MTKTIKTPAFTLLYNNQNATHDIAQVLIQADYTDYLTDQSDELSITVEDVDRRWINDWYPTAGATLVFAIGYEGEPLLQCGTFEIDEIDITDSPNTVRIRALSAGVSPALRTVNHRAFDKQTLPAILGSLALPVVGNIEPIMIERVTQDTTDLAFAKRLAHEYGYIIKVKDNQIIFSKITDINSSGAVLTLDRTQINRGWNFKDQIRTVKEDSTVSRYNSKKKENISGNAASSAPKSSNDQINSRSLATDSGVAKAKADGALVRDNDPKTTGSFSNDGHTSLISGNNIDLTGFGKLSGKCRLDKSAHSLSRQSGYQTQVDFTKVKGIKGISA